MHNNLELINRFRLFFKLTSLNKSRFSEALGIRNQHFNRLFKSETLILKLTPELYELGCSIDWLLSGNGVITADNQNGFKIIAENNMVDSSGCLRIYRAKDLIKKWIIFNYNTIEKFCDSHALESNKYRLFLENNKGDEISELFELDFLIKLEKAGCNLSWIFSDSKEPFAQNKIGKNLLEKKGEPRADVDFFNFKNYKSQDLN